MRQEVINKLFHFPMAMLANVIFRFPSRKLRMVGVTGTKGKTSTVHMIYHILRSESYKVMMISTIGAYFSRGGGSGFAGSEKELDTGLHVTNPDSFALQRILRRAVNEGYELAVVEVTSHGLEQFRNWGIRFELGVFTQVGKDHLEHHGGLAQYRLAKARLIGMSDKVLLNVDDRLIDYLSEAAAKTGVTVVKYRGRRSDFESQNEAAAVMAVRELGVSGQKARSDLKLFPGVRGRMETVFSKDFRIVIDFAHTADSLGAALSELRKKIGSGGRLIAVFGCAGERDPERREMGAVAAKMADYFIITAEDPRSESVEKISQEIIRHAVKAGAKEGTVPSEKEVRFGVVLDRQQAINYAISLAKEGDVVGLFGKGHEKSMAFGKKEKPWSEHRAVEMALDSVHRE